MTGVWRALTESERNGKMRASDASFGYYAPNAIQRFLIFICQKSILKRGVFRGRMTRIILALGKGKLDIKFRDCSYRIFGENNLIEYGLLLNSSYNEADIDFLLKDAGSDANFLDIGSNIGLYSQPLARHAPHGKTIAIDANPLMQSRLDFNRAASGLDNLMLFSTAVSDADGKARLEIRKDDIAIVRIAEDPKGDIPIRTITSVVKEAGLKSIHGLKIDIEGQEDKALVPFLRNSPKSLLPKSIVIEHPEADADYPECAKAFADLGYQLVGRSRNNSFYLRD